MADISKARIYYQDGRIEAYDDQSLAYALWLGMPKGIRCAFRGIGDSTPVYSWDYVDRL